MNIASFALTALLATAPAFAGPHDHDEENRVEIALTSHQTIAGNVVAEFRLLDHKDHRALTPNDLNITHEKKLHFLVYDPSLQEFQHVHPEFDGQSWKADLKFEVNGNYFVWAQGEVSADFEEFSTMTRLQVTGGSPAGPSPSLPDVRVGNLSGTIATLSGETLRAGQMTMLDLIFTREDGSGADITPYLGAFAHVIVTAEDGESLIHAHPMNGVAPNEGMLHMTFPTAGNYRLWVQFIDAGILKTIPLSVQVF